MVWLSLLVFTASPVEWSARLVCSVLMRLYVSISWPIGLQVHQMIRPSAGRCCQYGVGRFPAPLIKFKFKFNIVYLVRPLQLDR